MKGLLLFIFLGIYAEGTILASKPATGNTGHRHGKPYAVPLFSSKKGFASETLDKSLNVALLGRLLIAFNLLPALPSENRSPTTARKLHHFIQAVSKWTLTSSQIAGIALSCGILGYGISECNISEIDSDLIIPFTLTIVFASCIPTLAKAAKRSAKAGLEAFRLAFSSPSEQRE